ncbi:MAG: cytidylate kinase family protein [Desulfuromonadaceae bacterium]|nr:cytidylate kinase family protein [Desulfuromonadaceae bacterium]MDD5107390.1 cytidylate kinase family protein [Desulfuromonadaceae bacterium]
MAIITVSREMGTGAYQIASEVAQKLKYTLIDGQRIKSLATKYGLTPELLQMVDEKPPSYVTAEDRKRAAALHVIELIILELARKGNVVIYGRGAQDLMKECKNLLRLRFIADFEGRVERFAEREWIDPDMARSLIRRSDHQRGGFIHFYYDRDWQTPTYYDMIFNTSHLSQQTIVECIISATKEPTLKEYDKSAVATIDNLILSNRIETALLNSPALEDYRPFAISIYKGAVSISGYILSESQKKSAIDIIRSVKGVTSVADDIHVVDYKAYKEKM